MYPADCKYTKEHEWIRKDGGTWTVGITSHAADQLGDVTYVELPSEGESFRKGAAAASVESVKAASDIYAPAGGTVCGVNADLDSTPELVNQDPFGKGYFFKLSGVDGSETADLMDAAAYDVFVKALD